MFRRIRDAFSCVTTGSCDASGPSVRSIASVKHSAFSENDLVEAVSAVNPFALSIKEQLHRFHQANEDERWGIGEEQFVRLAATAPRWPWGPQSRTLFRSLRIRFGAGEEGVARTFEAHAGRIKAVFGDKFRRHEDLLSGKGYLRRCTDNHTHKPRVEWVLMELDANRRRESVAVVRSARSLADELLVFAWMFPEYIRTIDYIETPGLIAGGYMLNVPGDGGRPYQRVPCIDLKGFAVGLNLERKSNDYPFYSVPFLLK